MDTEYDFQSFSNKNSGKLSQTLPATYQGGTDENAGQTVDIAWVFAVFRRRILVMLGVMIGILVSSGAIIIWSASRIKPEYEGFFGLLVEPVTADNLAAKQFVNAQSQGIDIQKIDVERSSSLDYETQIRVLQSPQQMEPIFNQIKAKYPTVTYDMMMASLNIQRVTFTKDAATIGTKILEVSYRDKDPDMIEYVLKIIANAYLDYSFQERLKNLKNGIDFIDEQLPTLQQKVDTLQRELQILREQYHIDDPSVAWRVLADGVMSIKEKGLEVKGEIDQNKNLYDYMQKELQAGNTYSIFSTDVMKLNETTLGEIQRLDTQIAATAAQFRESSPPMQVLRAKQEKMKKLLDLQAESSLKNLDGRIKSLQERYQTIEQSENKLNQQLEDLPLVTRKYTDIQRELGVATDNLKEFLTKKSALRLDSAQQLAPWELIEKPSLRRDLHGKLIPTTQTQTKKNLAIVAVLSILLGIGVGFLVEVLNTVFHTPEEVKNTTKLPLLGVIPFAKELRKYQSRQKATSVPAVTGLPKLSSRTMVQENAISNPPPSHKPSFWEAFRSLHTNIRLLSPDRPFQSLVIGSAGPEDGKTTIAIYLALTAAAIGQRVLLVDSDLRHPKVHQKLGLPNNQGLSDAIATDLSLNDAIQRSTWEDNLFVLTSGTVPSDPVKLLSSKKMLYLMEQFQAFFDLVIYDTPPLAALADGSILAAHTNGIILTVGLEATDRSMLISALEGLKISGATVLGIVANGVKGYNPNA